MYKRIFKMIMSQGFGLLMNVIEKLLMVPLFIHAWGLTKFGEWILVRTIPNILLTSDVGISSHTGNEVNYYSEKGDYKQVSKTIYLSVLMMFCIVLILLSIGAVQLLYDGRKLFGVASIPQKDFSIAVFLMVIHASLILVSQLICGVSRIKNSYTFYALMAQISRFLEILSVSSALFFFNGSVIIVSICYVGTRLVINSIMLYYLIKELRSIAGISFRKIEGKHEYIGFIKKSVTYASVSFTQTIFMQGSSIIISNIFGPSFLALITIARNVSRFLVMFSSLVSKSIWTELTKLWAQGDLLAFNNLYKKFSLINFVILSLGFAMMIGFHSLILKWFNINENEIDNTFWIYLAVTVHSLLLALSYYSNIALIASSNHVGYAKFITVLSIISVILFGLISFYAQNIVTAYWASFCSVELLTLVVIHFVFMRKLDN
ncbi:transporter [Raoultella ornithinolytica]|uniref:transporter n=2 Tax=Raoultella ornithinolytica TaxID=54291 RepID=UPI00247AC50C|nr:transporter [Raoultella ornithinolytica]MDH7608863.1 transporter [Raoultella ornithinolytica]